jgi:preprotein translocase subunit SecE
MKAVKNYLKSSFEELSRVTWPTKNQAVRLTIIVLVFCFIIGLALTGLDQLFNLGYEYLLNLN